MSKIFTGMLLIFLNFNLTLGNSVIGLIPDFIGYYFIMKGLEELSEYSERFQRVRPFSLGMLLYTSVLYVLDLLGITTAKNNMLVLIPVLISVTISLYISYQIIMGIKDIEASKSLNLSSDNLYLCWKWMFAMNYLAYILLFIPGIAIFAILMGVIVNILFLISFYKTKNLFYSFNP